jgi:hypothetical protein
MSIGAANRGQLLITVTATLTCVAGARNYHRSVSAAPSPAVLARKVQAFFGAGAGDPSDRRRTGAAELCVLNRLGRIERRRLSPGAAAGSNVEGS